MHYCSAVMMVVRFYVKGYPGVRDTENVNLKDGEYSALEFSLIGIGSLLEQPRRRVLLTSKGNVMRRTEREGLREDIYVKM